MPAISYLSRRQLIWVLEGRLTFEEGTSKFDMLAGDCLELGDPADCVKACLNETSPAVSRRNAL